MRPRPRRKIHRGSARLLGPPSGENSQRVTDEKLRSMASGNHYTNGGYHKLRPASSNSGSAFRANRSLLLSLGELRRQKYVEDSPASSPAGAAANANRAAVLLNDS